ncbi:hypothetical protein IPJ72_01040 [Candidatus Peregrinibacteria bacterium]|nr:MAG: hypothetical protein IPJ72_01040 [Candidatus Peregrinibacteria bacterium]
MIQWMKETKGSLLIWSVVLGFTLSSLFLVVAIRQRTTVSLQRGTIVEMNVEDYMDSYLNYLASKYKSGELSGGMQIKFDRFTGTVDNKVSPVEEVIDFGESATYPFSGTLSIQWNQCNEPLRGHLLIRDADGDSTLKHDSGLDKLCLPNDIYDDRAGGILVNGPVEIQTINNPFAFQLNGPDIIDNKWHVNLFAQVSNQKKLEKSQIIE